MLEFKSVELAQVMSLGSELQAQTAGCRTVQEAAQAAVRRIHSNFADTLALARIFATLPFARLPEGDRAFVRGLARANGAEERLDDEALVLSLLGTQGAVESWNDRRSSEGHLGIPLLSTDFVASIPMVTQLMKQLGLGIDWIDARDTDIVVKTLGTGVGVFHVGDAATERDAQGRLIVPAQDFVTQQGVKTVFGLGGSFLDGTVLTLILFTREQLDREDAERYMPWLSLLKAGMSKLLFEKVLFA